jgi:hypothetical protein
MMRDWIAGIVGEDLATGAALVVVTVAIVLAFMVLFALFKGFSGTGIRGTRRARQARLAVMDAAIVDSRRRLVLVRRDDIEHLILIGGPTDVVVEQNIVHTGNSTLAKPQNIRSKSAPVAQKIPIPPEKPSVITHPVPATPARTQVNPSSVSPSSERSISVPSPQIRPVTKSPAPAASAPRVEPKTPVAPANTTSAQRLAGKSDTQPIRPTNPVTIPPATAPATKSSHGRNSPSLTQASASTVAVAAAAAIPVAVKTAPEVLPNPLVKSVPSEPIPSANDITKNHLTDFEDNLAMNLGETLVANEAPADKSDLASEMDEFLNEITSGNSR